MASHIWLRTILIVRKETRCRHIGYSYRLTARVLLYAPSHRQDNTYHSLCYTSRGALSGTRNSSMAPPHEGSIRRPTAPWANVLPLILLGIVRLLERALCSVTSDLNTCILAWLHVTWFNIACLCACGCVCDTYVCMVCMYVCVSGACVCVRVCVWYYSTSQRIRSISSLKQHHQQQTNNTFFLF